MRRTKRHRNGTESMRNTLIRHFSLWRAEGHRNSYSTVRALWTHRALPIRHRPMRHPFSKWKRRYSANTHTRLMACLAQFFDNQLCLCFIHNHFTSFIIISVPNQMYHIICLMSSISDANFLIVTKKRPKAVIFDMRYFTYFSCR